MDHINDVIPLDKDTPPPPELHTGVWTPFFSQTGGAELEDEILEKPILFTPANPIQMLESYVCPENGGGYSVFRIYAYDAKYSSQSRAVFKAPSTDYTRGTFWLGRGCNDRPILATKKPAPCTGARWIGLSNHVGICAVSDLNDIRRFCASHEGIYYRTPRGMRVVGFQCKVLRVITSVRLLLAPHVQLSDNPAAIGLLNPSYIERQEAFRDAVGHAVPSAIQYRIFGFLREEDFEQDEKK